MSAERFYGSGVGRSVSTKHAGRGGITVSGIPELDRALKALGDEISKRTIRGAMRKAMRLVADDAKGGIARHTGTLGDSITTKINLDVANATVMGRVYSSQRGKNRAPHAHLVEFGTGERRATRSWVRQVHGETYVTVQGQSFGRTQPNPFMEPAFDRNKRRIPQLFRRYLRDAINRKTKQRARLG